MVSADTTVTADMVISDYVRVLPWHTFQLPYDPENMLIMTFLFVCLFGRTTGPPRWNIIGVLFVSPWVWTLWSSCIWSVWQYKAVCLFVCNRGNTILRHGGLHTNLNQCNRGSYGTIHLRRRQIFTNF